MNEDMATNQNAREIFEQLGWFERAFERYDRAVIFKREDGISIPIDMVSMEHLVLVVNHPERTDSILEKLATEKIVTKEETLYAWYQGKEFLIQKGV